MIGAASVGIEANTTPATLEGFEDRSLNCRASTGQP
jgi:hypothetical protein